MIDYFPEELAHLLGIEGGYSDNANDRGGATNFGVTEAVARAHGFKGNMEDYKLSDAALVYRSSYWDAQSCGDIAAISRLVASELFDIGVNCGIRTAGIILQRVLNALNRNGKDYADITVDGSVGAGTVKALQALIAKRGKPGEEALLKGMNCLQGEHYIAISEYRPENEDFVFGWLTNRIAL